MELNPRRELARADGTLIPEQFVPESLEEIVRLHRFDPGGQCDLEWVDSGDFDVAIGKTT